MSRIATEQAARQLRSTVQDYSHARLRPDGKPLSEPQRHDTAWRCSDCDTLARRPPTTVTYTCAGCLHETRRRNGSCAPDFRKCPKCGWLAWPRDERTCPECGGKEMVAVGVERCGACGADLGVTDEDEHAMTCPGG